MRSILCNVPYPRLDLIVVVYDAISRYVFGILEQFYASDDIINNDNEIQSWIRDITENGFPSNAENRNLGLPEMLTSVSELADLLTKLLFTCTCKHAATHSEAVDMYGFEPKVPASMRAAPPTARGQAKKDMLTATLPEQDGDRYNAVVAYIMSVQKADEVNMSLSP